MQSVNQNPFSDNRPPFDQVEFIEATLMIYLGMVDKHQIAAGTEVAKANPKQFRALVQGSMALADDYLCSEKGQAALKQIREMLAK
jgi:hypothetical protein